MKRILFISPTGTLDNGAELSIVQLMELLKDKGHDVINVVQSSKSDFRKEYEEEMNRIGITLYNISLEKWWWPDAPGGLIQDMNKATTEYRVALARINEIIKEHQIDLVISNTVNVFLGAIAANLSRIPHYWLVHEFPENEFAYYQSKIPFIVNASNAIFTVDGNLKKTWEKLCPDVEINSFIPYTKLSVPKEIPIGEKTRFVSIGRINERKNQLELLKAYKEFDNSNTELCFIGPWDDDYKIQCDSFIEKNNLKNVSFLGYHGEPWKLVTDKDICVFPSSMETFGLVYIEAILNGIPVIASDNLGHRTVNELFDLPELYKLSSIEQLVACMQYSIEHFETVKKQANYYQEKVSAEYVPEVAYQTILRYINESISKSNEILSAVDFMLLSDSKPTKLELYGRKISFFLRRLRTRLGF